MQNNQYIQNIITYIENNTPVKFIFHEDKYQEIQLAIEKEQIINIDHELICACYSLFYSGLSYHKIAETDLLYQPYDILIGDYISSYITELLYNHKYTDILKVFVYSTKQLTLNLLRNNQEDHLLENLIKACKSR